MMRKSSPRFLIVLCLLTAIAGSLPLLAQSSSGSISGMVTDDTGAGIPGVTVTSLNRATGATRTTVSEGEGGFTIPLVPPGMYEVSGELSGFRPARVSNVTVNIGSAATVKLGMRVGIEESVTVTADAPLIETTRSQISSVVNERAIENLPVNGRNFIDFVLTTPGVVRDVRLGDISFAGQRGTLNSLIVDGANNDNTFFGQALGRTGSGRAPYQFSQDAVKEFVVNTNAYSAEYGRAGGAVINVITKSGTNDFHGTGFYFLRDRRYNANDYINKLNNRAKSPYHFDQYGVSAGGPIVRDKHFFFANYDVQRNSIPNLVVLGGGPFPTDAATQAGLAKLQALAGSYSRNQDQDVYLIKTDHELFTKNHLSLRYNRQEFVGLNFENGGITNALEHTGNSIVTTDTFSGVLTTGITSRLFNEVRAQYAKDQEPGQANSPNPEATIRQGGATVLTIGRNSFSPRETTIKRNQLADTVTYLRGAHTFKGGFDVNQDDILNFFPGNFSGLYQFDSIADFQNGKASRLVQAFAGPGTTGPTTKPDILETALFIQDEWRVMPSLTLNAGLRYDRQAIEQPSVRNPDAQLAAAGIDTSVVPEDDNNIGPRLGFAWTPGATGRTVVRGGYGIFYGRTPAIMIGTAHSNNGINVQTITFTGSLIPTYPSIYPSLPTGVTLPKPTILVFDKDFENPSVQQGSVGVEHGLTNDLSVGLSYQLVRGDDLQRSADINVSDPVDVTVPIQGGGSATYRKYNGRPFTNFARIIEFQSSASSEYDGVTLDVNKRFSRNWQARLAYTWSEVKDDKPDATAVVPVVDDPKYAQDALNFRGDFAPGDNDVEHRVVLSGVWSLDSYASRIREGFLHGLLGGWTLSGIASYQSGQPYSAVIGTDLNNDGNARNDRAPGFERNSFNTPDQFTVDPRITKDILIAGDLKLQLIAEAFNVLDRDNVSIERNVFYNLTNNTLVPVASFGSPSVSTGPRIVQLAAKLQF